MKKIAILCCGLLTAAAMQAQIIHVPGDYPTIQSGINASTPGDTILVAEGTYYEQINFLGRKPLMVASRFLMDGDTSHISKTIIDGSLLTNMDSASVVYFVSGEDSTSILCGFTIQHGKGTYTTDNLNDRQGGGIWISEAGAKIIHNRITHNTLDDTQPVNGNSTAGGGIGGKYADGDYWAVIANNTIDSNTCVSKYEYAAGGGIAISYNSRIFNNVISYNTCSGVQNAASEGGGMDCLQMPLWTTPVIMIVNHNTITHNLIQSQNNFATSAGILIMNVPVVFSNNEVAYNTAITGTTSGGVAGLLLVNPDPGSVVSSNVFKGNVSNLFTGGLGMQNDVILNNTVLVENNYFFDNVAENGGAFLTIDAPVILQNNVFKGNHAENYGGALYLWDYFGMSGHLATLVNNTFSGNTALGSGGAIYSIAADPLIFNCIFWQDSSAFYHEIHNTSGVVEIAYSEIDTNDIQGSRIIGSGVFYEDPQFADPQTLHPQVWSPCVDAGAAQYTSSIGAVIPAPLNDILGSARPAGSGFDMGAYDDIKGGVGIKRFTNYDLRITIYPNPIAVSTTFSYLLRESSSVTLQIFNSFGQLVAEPLNAYQSKGEQQFEWNSKNLPAGMYFYRIQTGDKLGSGKIVKY
ncbi:MAG: T9SS type A sorting domain-containing protein [Bacteroidetes bacterium]|nr:T9SS type A sorting domain-containing protein [Bacteroidota bacterium]